MRHLYIHIPFCHRRCAYCDFNTYANLEHRVEDYVQALCTELTLRAESLIPHPPSPIPCLPSPMLPPTIFFGGGTPTMLTLNQFARILEAASRLVPLEGAEITTEANPGTVLERDYLRGLRTLGINRLSMGVQSLHDPTLRVLGRIHTAAEARASFTDARAAGFENINLDFIFGLPGQNLDQWQATLDEIVTWGTDHFSLYSLILEEQTPLYAQVTSGRIIVPDDDATATMYEVAIERLAAANYVQYEISNWVLGSSSACAHNLAYWYNFDYGAAGAGAHGHHYPQRYYNILGVDDYITAVRAGRLPIAETVALSHNDLCAETMFMGLRLNAGVTRSHFLERSGAELDTIYGATIAHLAALGLIEDDGTSVRLTPHGRMLGNQVFQHFV